MSSANVHVRDRMRGRTGSFMVVFLASYNVQTLPLVGSEVVLVTMSIWVEWKTRAGHSGCGDVQ